MIECKKCDGSGYTFPSCERCYRLGWVDDPSDGGTITCPECEGESIERCKLCDGTGETETT